MFKKLKVDPEQLKEKINSTPSPKKSSCWYKQPVKTPKKTRKSLALRSARNRLSPYRSLLTCHGGNITWESPLIRGSLFNSTVKEGSSSSSSGFGKMSDFGKLDKRLSSDAEVCSCNSKDIACRCTERVDGTLCKCGNEARNCRFGSACKSKLLTFRTLATIVEESSEVQLGTKEKSSDDNRLKGASISSSESASQSNGIRAKALRGDLCTATSATGVPHFTNYRRAAVNSSPKIPPLASLQLRGNPLAARSSAQVAGPIVSRVPARPEYSCSQEARMAIDGLPDDTSVDDLAGYFDSIVYIPRKMSAMAEMMYT